MTYTLHTSVQGASHIQTGLPCQDASCTYQDASQGVVMAVVSDGHGSCPKSDLGAWLACEVAICCLQSFVRHTPPALTPEEQESRLRQLFASIVVEWQRGIAYDLNLPTAEVTSEQLHDYGCTLIGYLQTPEYWLGFQIGDGKLMVRLAANQVQNPAANQIQNLAANDARNLAATRTPVSLWQQPVPWDDECISNVTTSLCSSHTVDRFRYHYSTEASPLAIFLGSDGLDDTFGDGEGLERFYDHVIDSVITDGLTAVSRQMPRVLRHYSEVGSHDDMSVAMVLNI